MNDDGIAQTITATKKSLRNIIDMIDHTLCTAMDTVPRNAPYVIRLITIRHTMIVDLCNWQIIEMKRSKE